MSRRDRLPPGRARRLTAAGCLAAVLGPGLLTACSADGPVPAHPVAPASPGRTASPARGPRPGAPQIGVIGSYTVGDRTVRLVEAAHAGPGGGRTGTRVLPTLTPA
jgi:hypothetical protein